MSPNVPNSGVRNLRAMFENKEDGASESRSRSPAGSNASETRRTSRVRASFVSVEAGSGSQGETEEDDQHGLKFQTQFPTSISTLTQPKSYTDISIPKAPSSASARRPSFSLTDPQDSDKIAELKKSVSQEKEERKQSRVSEIIPESAIESTPSASPAIKPRKDKAMGDFVNVLGTGLKNSTSPPKDTPGTNPDKAISGVEETPVAMKPTDPKDAIAVSGSEALPPPAEPVSELSAETSQASPATNDDSATGSSSKANAVRAKPVVKPNGTAVKSQASAKSTDSKPTSKPPSARPSATSAKPSSTVKPTGAGATPKSPSTRQSRTSLESTKSAASTKSSAAARPTAASAAKKAESALTAGDHAKAKPRSPTRPVKLPSHLTAPTASSAAKHGDTPSAPSATARKPAPRPSAGVAKPAAPRRDAPRQSLSSTNNAKPSESRTSARAPDDSFLARMTRPTASSASKTAEKQDVKSSPPKRSGSIRPKQSTQSLTGKTKRTAPATPKGKESEQNGTAAHDEDHHEGETSMVADDVFATEPAPDGPQELPETPATPKAASVPDSVPESVPASASEKERQSASGLAPHAAKDAIPGLAPEPPETPAHKLTEPEPVQAATPPEFAEAIASEVAKEQRTESAPEEPSELSASSGKGPEVGAEGGEEDAAHYVESMPEQAPTADAASE
ncbi:MAG: hypothetical protein M1822_000801 [Bathelium mastoideum]|nr:MAG: hypothetical protein M1822_000801 [Bathelium mastoideum]